MSNEQILDAVDPEYIDRLAERRAEIERGSYTSPGIAAALAMGAVPIALAALSRDVYGQAGIPANVKAVFDFALALEIFENEFYKAVLGTSSSSAQNSAFAGIRGQVPAAGVATLQQIQKHEAAHVSTLTSLGATNVFNLSATSFDFTGARGAGNGPFAAATSNLDFLLTVAQGAEDTGVRAYKGQAPNLLGTGAYLEGALRIHSVEARHASRIRRIRRSLNTGVTALRWSGTVRGGGAAAAGATGSPSAAVVAAFDKIYGPGADAANYPSEANTTQGGLNLGTSFSTNVSGFNAEAFAEAFDEPLARADVVAIVQPFFIPDIQ